MKRASYTRTLYNLCINPEDTNPHLIALENELNYKIHRITTDNLLEANPVHRNKILVIDYREHKYLHQQTLNLPLLSKNFETILIHVPKKLTTQELLKFGQLKGIFYHNESPTQISKGLQRIVDGENWLPRKVMSQLLHYYRHVLNTHTAPITVDLTIRELEVLRCLQSGSTTIQIADDLFVSEFTIKSHLHHIFKKLAVKNRVQAIAWADQNLVT